MAAEEKPKTILFFHPDLGIGGAERLIIDAAVGLQNRGHKIVMFTSHCDPKHCFDEARDGRVELKVLSLFWNIVSNIDNRYSRCASPRQLASSPFNPISILHNMRHSTTTTPHSLDILHIRAQSIKTRRLCGRPAKCRSAMAGISIPEYQNIILLPFPRSLTRPRTVFVVEACIPDTF